MRWAAPVAAVHRDRLYRTAVRIKHILVRHVQGAILGLFFRDPLTSQDQQRVIQKGGQLHLLPIFMTLTFIYCQYS